MPDPRRDEKGLERLVRFLTRPRTVEQICDRFDLSERSAYRWLDYLKEDEHEIISRKRADGVAFSIEMA